MSVENRGLVLVAEDEKPIADLIGMYLRRDGFGVHAVSTGAPVVLSKLQVSAGSDAFTALMQYVVASTRATVTVLPSVAVNSTMPAIGSWLPAATTALKSPCSSTAADSTAVAAFLRSALRAER